ncbi:hypothetical protein PO909_029590 [Leuciscus waleckii]
MAETRTTDRQEKKYDFHGKINKRYCPEVSHDGHISINDLRNALQDDTNVQQIRRDFMIIDLRNYDLKILGYLTGNIPEYPNPVEFHISEVTHVTDENSFDQICESEGFKAYGNDDEKFSWWSLKIDERSIEAAEQRYLEKVFPNRSEEQKKKQDEFLNKFTTSPAFHIKESRYGTVRFSFPLNELMKTYTEQVCGDQGDPVLREYKTMFYKQEIMYVVLVHSPEHNERFEKFPRIKNEDYEENQIVWKAQENLIVWKAQAIGNAIEFKLILNEEDKITEIEPAQKQYYYVWDHVCLAFHFDGVLKFTEEDLKKSVTHCELSQKNCSIRNNLQQS